MKNYYLCLLFIVFSLSNCFSQIYVFGLDLNEEPLQYIEIEFEIYRFLTNDYRVLVDFGQENRRMGNHALELKDRRKGNDPLLFFSKVGALNWFYKQGWEVVDSYHKFTGGDSVSGEIIYLLQRRT